MTVSFPEGPQIRGLRAADLAACGRLAADRGWPREQNKWRLLLAISEAYGVDDPAGELAASIVLTRYGERLASVGMMLVAARYGRQGLAGACWRTWLSGRAQPLSISPRAATAASCARTSDFASSTRSTGTPARGS
jgi:hypothetical protein